MAQTGTPESRAKRVSSRLRANLTPERGPFAPSPKERRTFWRKIRERLGPGEELMMESPDYRFIGYLESLA